MGKSQGSGMQRLTGTKLQGIIHEGPVGRECRTFYHRRTSIHFICKQRMAKPAEVGADLMRASCFEAALHQ